MTTPHPLYLAAVAADERLNELCARVGRTRWTMTPADAASPNVRRAMQNKLDADAAWLACLREDSQQRSERRTT